MELNLHDTLNDLEEKAKKATPGPWKESGMDICAPKASTFLSGGLKLVVGDADYLNEEDQSYIAACSPDTVLALITALREAEETLELYTSRDGRVEVDPGLEARDWLAKYAKEKK